MNRLKSQKTSKIAKPNEIALEVRKRKVEGKQESHDD